MTDTVLTPTVAAPIAPAFARLWTAVGILGVTTLAMGATLVQTHMQAQSQLLPQTQVVASATPALSLATTTAPVPTQLGEPRAVESTQAKTAAAHVYTARPAIKKVAIKDHHQGPTAVVSTPHPTYNTAYPDASVAQSTSPLVLPAPQEVCLQCGTVVAVTTVQREPEQGSGVGAVAGAVLGGLLGNQFGGGDGKAILTVAGALGGGWAGNTVEKRMKKEVVYQVDLRMQDGSMRRMEQSTPVVVGDRVKLEAGVIRPQTV